jgi:hypothetical protein
MPTYQIPCGVPTQIAQNAVWALPSFKVRVRAEPNCELAQSATGPWAAMTGPVEGFDSAASYIRCTTAAAMVTCVKG